MRLVIPVIASLLLVLLASCGSRAHTPAAAQPNADGAPAPGEAERLAPLTATSTRRRGRVWRKSRQTAARFSLAYALY